uniref:Uncharacterized protein n=1 Tax=Picea glauca TaxID=3330 RepID=A0A124GNB4_PICGL|nr:hypothetical protein ABT39_MTgene5258 [Picea glauca]QHR88814.1 hypothetical protein Q903MT_gene2830 [Picea sitchensis]
MKQSGNTYIFVTSSFQVMDFWDPTSLYWTYWILPAATECMLLTSFLAYATVGNLYFVSLHLQ